MQALSLALLLIAVSVAGGCALVSGAAALSTFRRSSARPSRRGVASGRAGAAGPVDLVGSSAETLLDLQVEIEALREQVRSQELRLRCLVAQYEDVRDVGGFACPRCRASELRA